MAKKTIEGVKMGNTWTTYMGSAEGALRAAGMWDGETHMLMGMTGMAFHFIVHEKACPSSVTVYDWTGEHFIMMDRIGVYSDSIMSMKDETCNTFANAQEDAIEKIRKSIDRGVPVIAWAPTPLLEFGLIKGYDDDEKVLDVIDCVDKDPDPLMYSNIGKSEAPFVYVQFLKEKVETDPERAYRSSLEFGVYEWNKKNHVDPHYASGRLGYDNLIGTLERGDFKEFGLSYILSVYDDSKRNIVKYLEELVKNSRNLKGLEEPLKLYGKVSQNYAKLVEIVPFRGPQMAFVDWKSLPEMINLVKESKDLEDRAMAMIDESLRR